MKKGATYRLLGSNPNPDLLNEPYTWHGGAPKRLRLNHTSSSLSSALCGGYVANCKPNKAAIILDADLPCNGLECNVHEPRTFEAAPGIYFEYVRPPCVNHAFYENPRTIYRRWGSSGEDNFQCGNPESFAASTLCCNASKSWDSAWRSEMFSGERVPLKTAEARCSAPLWRMCNDTWITSADCSTNGGCDNYNVFHWLRPGCTLSVKVSLDGAIAIVHKHGLTTNKQDISKSDVLQQKNRILVHQYRSLIFYLYPSLVLVPQTTLEWSEGKCPNQINHLHIFADVAYCFLALSHFVVTHGCSFELTGCLRMRLWTTSC